MPDDKELFERFWKPIEQAKAAGLKTVSMNIELLELVFSAALEADRGERETKITCNCCNDLAQVAAEFADATRCENKEQAVQHQERAMDIIARHAGHIQWEPVQPPDREHLADVRRIAEISAATGKRPSEITREKRKP